MIDAGSAVNLLPLRMLKRLGIAIHVVGASMIFFDRLDRQQRKVA